MKLSLNVKQRISVAQFLPKEGSLSEQLMGKSILDKASVSLSERENLRFDTLNENRIMDHSESIKEVEFTAEEFDLLFTNFLQKDKDKQINRTNVDLALVIRDAKK